jgi:hypothetical protein
MRYAPSDEPKEDEADDDPQLFPAAAGARPAIGRLGRRAKGGDDEATEPQADDRGDAPTTDDVQQPSIVAGVGSSALGSADIEPQRERHPDNDGETVEE